MNTLRTSDEYIEALKKMKPNVYMGGEKVNRDDPRFKPMLEVLKTTYDLANDPAYDGLVTARSHLIGKNVNRFNHIIMSREDLLRKQKMIRLCCRRVGGCILRCMGGDALNALFRVTYDIDQAKGTDYHKRFLKYLKYIQINDLMLPNCAQTDVKGDRSQRPSEQADPDMYVHIVERRKDGIIVRGAKAHNTSAAQSEELIVIPTRNLVEGEDEWAVAFAIPADWDRIKLIIRASSPRERKKLESPISHIGSAESFTVFDDTFVPWERVFMCGESAFAGTLALQFANNHRHSYTGCKPATTDVILGAAALTADYYGIEHAQHVRMKLAHLIGLAELVFAAGVAAAMEAEKTPSGCYAPNMIYVNVGRRYAGENVYTEYEILSDIAGGIPATLPYEEDFINPETRSYLQKYIKRRANISAEDHHRLLRMLSDMLCSAWAGAWQVAGVHGGGSPIMETIALLRSYNLETRKIIAKYLAGIISKEGYDAVDKEETTMFLKYLEMLKLKEDYK